MSNKLEFDPARTALLCMDCQTAIVSAYTGDQQDEFLLRSAGILEAARNRGIQVIYVQVGFRPGFPEISSRNLLLNTIKNSPERRQMFEGAAREIHPKIAPTKNDPIVTKHRVSAFEGTDLELLLRAKEIDTLALFGIATSGVVLSTLTHAFDTDYKLFVIKDCCADGNPELHNALIDRYFPSRGQVTTAAEFEQMIK